MSKLRALVALVPLAVTACPDNNVPPDPTPAPNFGTVEGLAACDTATVEQNPGKRCFTSRAVAGVSMGGGTAGRIGFRHPELWDVVGIMGTPFADNEFFFRMLKDNHMAGFCDLATLEQLVADGVDLDDETNPAVFCGVHDVFPIEGGDQADPGYFPAVEGTTCSMFRSDFNHWYRGPNAGRGGSFSRNGLIDIMHDLVAAFGNPFYANGDDFYFPPGVPPEWHVRPLLDGQEVHDALCAAPISIEGVFSREHNPEGTYPVVTFCDGNTTDGDDPTAGDYKPDERSRPKAVEFLLAVDINRNGRRDYGEPVILNNEERFRDCGVDNACDGDAGDDADDNWDPMTNPAGTEGNFRVDDGEDFDDDGVDGVPGTADFGEQNGVWDRTPALQRMVDDSPKNLLARLPESQTARFDVWMDAGVRDFLNTAQTSNTLFAELKDRLPTAAVYNDFASMPLDPKYTDGGDLYKYYMSDYSRAAMGQVAYLRYGSTEYCPSSDDNEGEGNHVGAGDVVSRIFTLFSFLSERMPAQGRDESFGGNITDLAPNRDLNDFAFLSSYRSETLSRDVEYGILLPPDYFVEPDAEYPVLYFFHGQGMTAEGLVPLGLALIGPMKESVRSDRVAAGKTDLQRAIIIWVDGECHDDQCFTGNFYTDFKGAPRDDRRFETAFYELARHVESTYRTLPPQLIPLDEIEN